ncbi:MAG: hypothetical protein ACPGXY_02965 [Alphaproteobacteria bacterium]
MASEISSTTQHYANNVVQAKQQLQMKSAPVAAASEATREAKTTAAGVNPMAPAKPVDDAHVQEKKQVGTAEKAAPGMKVKDLRVVVHGFVQVKTSDPATGKEMKYPSDEVCNMYEEAAEAESNVAEEV